MNKSTPLNKSEGKKKEEEKIIQSYIYTNNGYFFISTCYREGSSIMGGWYYETFGWLLNEKNEQTDFIEDNSGALTIQSALKQHFESCKKLAIL